MAEFKIHGVSYKTQRLEVRKSAHVLRRLGPILPYLTMILKAEKDGMPMLDAALALTDARIGAPLMSALGKLTDADQDYILDACLATTVRHSADPDKQNGVWADVWVAQGGMMFDDIGLFEMGTIAWHVLQDTFRPFFSALQAVAQPAGKPKQAA